MKITARVLHLEDSPRDAELIQQKLESGGLACEIVLVDSKQGFESALAKDVYDVILCDYNLPDYDGSSALALARERLPLVPVIILSGTLGEEEAVECLKQGATDYVLKHRLERLAPAVKRALQEAEEHRKRREAEELLRSSEARYRALFNGSADGILIADLETKMFKYANAALCRMLEYTEADLQTMTVLDIHPQAAVPSVVAEFGALARGEKALAMNIPCLRKGGSVVHADIKAVKITLDDRPCNVGFFRDITERKHAEEVVQRSERNYREIFNAANDAIFLHEAATGRILDVNDAMLRLYGYGAREEVLASHSDDLSANEPPYTQEEAQRAIRLAIEKGPRLFEWRARKKSGERFWVEVSLRSSEIGGEGCILAVVRDISERKQAEARLQCFARLGHLLSTISTQEQAARIIADAASDLLGWDACYLTLGSLADGRVTSLIHIDTINGQRVAVPLPEAASRPTPMFRRVLTEGAQLILRQHPEEAGPQLEPMGDLKRRSLSLMFVPIRQEGNPLGVFSVQSYQPRTYNASDLETLQALADHGAGTLERLRTEAALRESEERFRGVYENALMGLYRTTPDGRILLANPALVRMLGYRSFEELARQNLETQGFHPDYPRGTFKGAVEQDGILHGLESAWIRADGTTVFVRESAQAVRDEQGRILCYDGVVEDITERKRDEEKLRQQAALLDAANDAIYVRALDHTVTYWNSGATRLFGRSHAEALGRRITELGIADPEAFAAAHAALLERGDWSGELTRATETGRMLVVFCRWTLLRDEQDRPSQVLAINADITEQKLTQAKFLRAQRVESIGSLASGIAHDLNNILTPIIMCAPMLQLDETPEGRQEMARMIEASAHRAVGIVKQLLTFARGKEGQKTTLQVRHLVREMAKIACEVFPRSIQVEEGCASDLWPVLADATQLHQVVLNLCVNARDAMPSGGKLTLRAENVTLDELYVSMNQEARPGPYVRLQVADNGTGIPDGVRDRIFESFFTTKGEGQGTGLGLTTVQGIVRDHGGFITFTTAPGKGTLFEVHLPAVPEARPLVETAQSRMAIPRGQAELVLVVDDEPAVRDATRRTLERFGYAVLQAHDGIEALAQFTAHRAEVRAVVTDFMMPLMDGVTLCRILLAMSPHTPLIVASGGFIGNPGSEALRVFEELGIRHILPKPHTAEVLLRALGEVIQPSRTPAVP